MNKEKCSVCGKYMGNSLNNILGFLVHVKCASQFQVVKEKPLTLWQKIKNLIKRGH